MLQAGTTISVARRIRASSLLDQVFLHLVDTSGEDSRNTRKIQLEEGMTQDNALAKRGSCKNLSFVLTNDREFGCVYSCTLDPNFLSLT